MKNDSDHRSLEETNLTIENPEISQMLLISYNILYNILYNIYIYITIIYILLYNLRAAAPAADPGKELPFLKYERC